MNRIANNKHARKKEKKKLTKKQKIIIWSVVGGIALILAIIMGVYIYKAGGNIKKAAINMVADAVGDETPVTALIMGVSEGIDTPLTDTIILAGYNPKTQASFMLSIPRDTFVGNNENTANGYDKINALYQKDVKKTVAAVEKLTGVKIDYYVVVKTSALVQVVDAIGGVEFDVPIDMKYDDPTQNLHIDLKKGLQKIDGPKAEQLLRYRHSNPDANGKMTTYPASYGSDDFGRMRTQREFITATVKQMADWKNLSKAKNILSAVFDNLETNMSLGKMIGYIPSALKLDIASIRAEQLPGDSAMINNLWFYKSDSTKTCELVTELMQSLGLSEKEYNKKYQPIKKIKSTNKKVDDNTIKTESSLTENKVKDNTVIDNSRLNENNTSVTQQTVNPETCNHHWTLTINHEPTCVVSGARNYTCTICGSEKSEVIPATGNHTWVELPSSRIEPTENSEGSVTLQCTVCGQTSSKVLDKLPKTTPEPTVEPTPQQPETPPVEPPTEEPSTQPPTE